MANTPIDEIRFTDKELQEILEKAVKQHSAKALVKEDGVSLAELKEIGKEVGIDAGRLEDAARAVAMSRRDSGSNAFLGGPLVISHERRIDGELDRDDIPEVVSIIRRMMGQHGEVDEVHDSLEWKSKGDSGERYVTVSPRKGTTTLQASANLTNAAAITYITGGTVGFISALIGFITFAKSGSEIGLIVGLAILPVLYAALRSTFANLAGKESAKLQALLDELAQLPDSK